MVSSTFIWRSEKVDHIYKFQLVVAYALFTAGSISTLFSGEEIIMKLKEPCLHKMFISAICIYILMKTLNSDLRWKNLLAHTIAEIVLDLNLYYAFYSHKSNSEYFIINTFAILVFYQLKLSYTLSQAVFFTAKYIICIVIGKYMAGSARFDFMMPVLCCILIGLSLFNFNLDSNREIERIRACKKLEKMTRELEGILLSIPEGLLIVDCDMNILHYNTRILQQFSTSTIQDLILKSKHSPIYKNISCLDSPLETSLYQEIQNLLQVQLLEPVTIGVVKEGDCLYEFRAKKWKIDKEILIITVRDVSEVFMLKEARRESYLKTVLLRSVSHELRTPTSCIENFAEQIRDDENLSIKGAYKIEMMITCSRHLLFLINDLLDFSKFMSGVFKINKRDFNTREVLFKCFELIKIQASNKNLITNLIVDPLLPEISFNDEIRLSQVIFNLLGNAIKFTSKGSVTMNVYLTYLGKMKVLVKDTGIGISPEKQLELFKPFGKLNDTNPNINPQGCGLGLYISNLLVQAMGGEQIRVKSYPWRGSSFSFEIPIDYCDATDELQTAGSMMIIPKEKINGKAVFIPESLIGNEREAHLPPLLLADDNEFNRIVLREYLNKIGILYQEARNGREVLELIKKREITNSQQFRVVILDCEMPILDGWRVSIKLNKMYSQKKLKRMPALIGHTAYTSEEDLKKCFDSGMKDVIPKPVRLKDFGEIVKHYLNN